MKEIANLSNRELREFTKEVWANFHNKKNFLTLGLCFAEIKDRKLYREWSHGNLSEYCAKELRFPPSQWISYVVATRRLRALGFNQIDMEQIEARTNLKRTLPASKISSSMTTFLNLIKLDSDEFQIEKRRIKKHSRFTIGPFSMSARELEVLQIALRTTGLHSEKIDKEALLRIAIFASFSTQTEEQRKRAATRSRGIGLN